MSLPVNFTDLDAYDLIHAVAVAGDELHPDTVKLLAMWALAKAERVDELEDRIKALTRIEVRP